MNADRNLNMIIEQNIKAVLGEQAFQIIALNAQLMEAMKTINKIEEHKEDGSTKGPKNKTPSVGG